MLQELIRSAIVVTPARHVGEAIQPLPLEPGEPDLNACSLDNLAALADAAYRAGDRASAEQFIRRLYAQYDQPKAKPGMAPRAGRRTGVGQRGA